MTALASAPSLFDQPGGGPTLDEAIVGVWEGLAARMVVDCPVCGGEMVPRVDERFVLAGGRCGDCGSTLTLGYAGGAG